MATGAKQNLQPFISNGDVSIWVKKFRVGRKKPQKTNKQKTFPFPKIAYIADFPPRKRDFIVVVPYFHIQVIALENLPLYRYFSPFFSVR